MKKLVILTILLLLNSIFINAVDWTSEDATSDQNFEENFKADPKGGLKHAPEKAFETDPGLAFSALESDSELRQDKNIRDIAFSTDFEKTANTFNNNPGDIDMGIIDRVTARAVSQGKPFVLNDNPNIKKKWFKSLQITDYGAELDSYDGNVVKTSGSKGTTFNVNSHPGAKLTTEGELILSDETKISNSIVKKIDGNLLLTGGHVDCTESKHRDFTIKGGKIEYDGRVYSSDTEISANVGDGLVVRGNGVVEMDDGSVLAEFDGKLKEKNGAKSFQGTYTHYVQGQRAATFQTQKETALFDCAGKKNCIEADEQLIFHVDENNINAELHGDKIKHITVMPIDDSSTVTVKKGYRKIQFSKEPMTLQGSLTKLGLDITTYYNGKEYNLNYIEHETGDGSMSKEQFMNNIDYLMEQGYDIHDIAFAYQKHYYDSLDYYGGVLSGKFWGMFAPRPGSQGKNYNDPKLQEQIKNLFSKDVSYVQDNDKNYKVSHTFAGIAAAANTNPVWGRVKTLINTDLGDMGQVVVHTKNNIMGGDFDIADEYRPEPQKNANRMGRELAPAFASGNANDKDFVLNKFEESFENS